EVLVTAAQKVAIVTGGSRGIGSAIAKELAAQGIAVAVNYTKRKDAADATVNAITGAGGKAMAVQASVENAADQDKMFKAVQDKFGRLDILVNNAGVGGTAPIDQVDGALIDNTIGINLKAMLLASQRAV